MGKAIAVQGCTVQVNAGAVSGVFVIKTSPDSNVQINSTPCYFGDIEVTIPSGSTIASGASLADSVTVTITATGSNATTSKGNAVLLDDKSSGEDMGTFVQGSSSTKVALQAVISEAGQSDVTLD